jgi:biotin transport system substrate-specific component
MAMDLVLRREIILDKTLCRILGVTAFVVLTTLGAFVRIPLPFTPVPITLQTLFVLLGASFLGGNLGSITQLTYILLGVLGLPIFTGAGSGLVYLAGPTGGYLFGFVLASFFTGHFIKYSENNFFLTLAIVFSADLVLLLCGTLWLEFIFGYPMTKILMIGFIPFIPGDLLKVITVTFLYRRLKSRLQQIF